MGRIANVHRRVLMPRPQDRVGIVGRIGRLPVRGPAPRPPAPPAPPPGVATGTASKRDTGPLR